MSYDRLKKLGGGSTGSYKYENPYAKKTPTTAKAQAPAEEGYMAKGPEKERSILEQNNYLLSQLYELKRQQEDLKFDIVTLLMMMEDKEEGDGELFKISAQAMREKYFGFRASKKHVLNRIIDKTETIINKDLNFNDNRTTAE